MRYLYGAGDEKFVKKKVIARKKIDPLSSFKFVSHPYVKSKTNDDAFNRNNVPILSLCTPDKLLNLCVNVVDKMSLIEIYKWTIEDICCWLRALDFKQYQVS